MLHDNNFGMGLLTEHLVARGHRTIGYIGGPSEESSAAERLAGFTAALAHHGLALDPLLVRATDWEQISGGYETTLELLEEGIGRSPR